MQTTIILPISRDSYIKRIFSQLELMECDTNETALLIYVDGSHDLFEKVKPFVINCKFIHKRYVLRGKGLPSVGSVKRRRQRIADIHNEIKKFVEPCEYIFSIEDDTLFPTSTLKKLLTDYSYYPYAGLITGVELGRWGYLHVGAWKVDNVYEPTQITSVLIDSEIKEIDASGLYCCLTKYEVYMKHEFEPFDEALGPDFNYGLDLRKQGYSNYINYSINCTHLTKHGEIKVFDSEIVSVQFNKVDKKWVFGVI